MIRLLKIITGEEVIASVEEKGDVYELKNPVRIIMNHTGEVGMVAFSPFTKGEKIELKKDSVLFVAELEEEVYNAYNGKFGSGIVVPQINPDLKLSD